MSSLSRLLPASDGELSESRIFVGLAVAFGVGSGAFIGLVVAPTAHQSSDLVFLWPCCQCPDPLAGRSLFLFSGGPAPPTFKTAVASFWDAAVHPVRCRTHALTRVLYQMT